MKNKGITLIALVITIVVLIILAAVAINLSLGNNGIFNRAKTAKEQYTNALDYEDTEVSKVSNSIDELVGNSRSLSEDDIRRIVREELQNQGTIRFMDLTNKIHSFTGAGSSWTATQDCGIVASIKATTTSYNPMVLVDGVSVFENSFPNTAANTRISFYVKKGSVVSTRSDCGTYIIDVYALTN